MKPVARLNVQLAQFQGFAASVVTKVLHKKCPALIPILDNHAIFGAYMNPEWDTLLKTTLGDRIKDKARINKALD